jgi:preprotein translocase subunit SecD
MRRQETTWLAWIVVLALLSAVIYLLVFVVTYKPLDTQIVLTLREDTTASPATREDDLRRTRDVVAARVAQLHFADWRVETQGAGSIVIKLPNDGSARNAISTMRLPGELELIAAGSAPIPGDMLVSTDRGAPTDVQLKIARQSEPYAGGHVYPVVATDAGIDRDKVTIVNGTQTGTSRVEITFQAQAAETLRQFTRDHPGQYLGILLDKRVLACPVIVVELSGNVLTVDHLSPDDAQQLAVQLRSGPLPAPLSDTIEMVQP